MTNPYRRLLKNDTKVTGGALAQETFVKVKWEWLAFIACQIVLSIGLLLYVMILTSIAGIGPIKSSLLPVLFAVNAKGQYSLEQGHAAQEHQNEFYNVGKKSQGIIGRFEMAEHGWIIRR